MSRQLGNIAAGQLLTFLFPTENANGVSVAPITPGNVYVYKDDDATENSIGVTYTPSFDGVDGVNLVKIDTADAFYETGHDYSVVLIGAVVPGVLGFGPSTINTVLAEFSIENRADATITAIYAKVSSIQTGRISVTSPIADTGVLTIIRGDDYSDETNKPIVFEDTGTICPDLTEAHSVTLTVRLVKNEALQFTKAGVVLGPRKVQFSPTHDDTANLVCGSLNSRYDVEAVLADGSIVTPFLGDCTVIADVTLVNNV